MLWYHVNEERLFYHRLRDAGRRLGAGAAGPKGAPPAIPPIIINPFRYQVPGPAIDPRAPPPNPPIAPPSPPAMSLALA